MSVVDEGILSLTNFQTPDPLAQLFAKRALGVETYETLGWTMLHQPAGASSKTGGGDYEEDEEGGGGERCGRVQPAETGRAVLRRAAVGTDGKRRLPVPRRRIAASCASWRSPQARRRSAAPERRSPSRIPLVIQVTFPRFAPQGDEMQIPVFMTNMSGGPARGLAHARQHGDSDRRPRAAEDRSRAADVLGKDNGSIKIRDGLAETLVFRAKANMPVGGAKLRVVAKAKGKAGTFEVADGRGAVLAVGSEGARRAEDQGLDGQARSVDPAALKNWMPTSEQTTFWLTSNPYGESFDHLKYLIHYPYGCIEQTTSSTRPLLYVGNIVEQVDPQLAQLKIEDMVLLGINRVLVDGDAVGRLATGPARRSLPSGAPHTRRTCCSTRRRPATRYPRIACRAC